MLVISPNCYFYIPFFVGKSNVKPSFYGCFINRKKTLGRSQQLDATWSRSESHSAPRVAFSKEKRVDKAGSTCVLQDGKGGCVQYTHQLIHIMIHIQRNWGWCLFEFTTVLILGGFFVLNRAPARITGNYLQDRKGRSIRLQRGVLASGSPLQKTLTADLSEILPVSNLETYRIYYIPSGNQILQWTISRLWMIFPWYKTSIEFADLPAMFDYQRVHGPMGTPVPFPWPRFTAWGCMARHVSDKHNMNKWNWTNGISPARCIGYVGL